MSDNKKLSDILEQGETVQWSGTSQPYSLWGDSHKRSTIISLCWALVWGVILIGGYYASAVSKGVDVQPGVMAFCVAVPVFILWMLISDKNKIKKLVYAVTDKRAIVLFDKPMSMRIADIDAIRVDKADNGNCHVRLGSSTFGVSSKKLPGLAWRGLFSAQNNDKVYSGLVFFNVRNEDEKIIRSLLQPADSSAEL